MHDDVLRVAVLLLLMPIEASAANLCTGGNPGGPNHNGHTCYDAAPTVSVASCSAIVSGDTCDDCDDTTSNGAISGGEGGACCLSCSCCENSGAPPKAPTSTPPSTPPSFGWFVGAPGFSCDDVCQAAGVYCDHNLFFDQIGAVATLADFRTVFDAAAGYQGVDVSTCIISGPNNWDTTPSFKHADSKCAVSGHTGVGSVNCDLLHAERLRLCKSHIYSNPPHPTP